MEIATRRRIKTTMVYDAYWSFACERMSIYHKRIEGYKSPWTEDEILRKHKFTNAYRVIDRVSQYLVREIILPDEKNGTDLYDKIFRILLFKTFNKIETWKLLKDHINDLSWHNYNFEIFNKVLSQAMSSNQPIYSAAYIMASGKRNFGHEKKHENHLKLLEFMMKDRFVEKIIDCNKMENLFDLLMSYPTIGDFLAYQYATDINYSSVTNFSEMEFVKAGPGAIDGIRKCFTSTGGYTNEDIIRYMAEQQEFEFERLGLIFSSLYNRKLMLIDCQNLFCEIGKYARVAYPDYIGTSNRKKIKQLYKTSHDLELPCFPTKWNIRMPMKDRR